MLREVTNNRHYFLLIEHIQKTTWGEPRSRRSKIPEDVSKEHHGQKTSNHFYRNNFDILCVE